MTAPLVSVIVATYQRHAPLLEKCLPSIVAQDYANVEVIVVSDGPDPDLASSMDLFIRQTKVPVRYFETGRNWHSLSGVSWGTEPRTLGAFAARGEYLCYVDDDDTVTPDHVSTLVSALHGSPDWFVLGQYRYPDGRIVGDGTIEPSKVGTCMALFRPECLCASVMRPGSYLGDFEWLARMAQAGMTWGFVAKPTYLVSHALEAMGSAV